MEGRADDLIHKHQSSQTNIRSRISQNHTVHGAVGTHPTVAAGGSPPPTPLHPAGSTKRNNVIARPHFPPHGKRNPALLNDPLSPMHMTDNRSPSTPSWRSRCASSPARTPVRRPSLRMTTGSTAPDADAADAADAAVDAARPLRVGVPPTVVGVTGGDGEPGVKARGSGDGTGDEGATAAASGRGGDGGAPDAGGASRGDGASAAAATAAAGSATAAAGSATAEEVPSGFAIGCWGGKNVGQWREGDGRQSGRDDTAVVGARHLPSDPPMWRSWKAQRREVLSRLRQWRAGDGASGLRWCLGPSTLGVMRIHNLAWRLLQV